MFRVHPECPFIVRPDPDGPVPGFQQGGYIRIVVAAGLMAERSRVQIHVIQSPTGTDINTPAAVLQQDVDAVIRHGSNVVAVMAVILAPTVLLDDIQSFRGRPHQKYISHFFHALDILDIQLLLVISGSSAAPQAVVGCPDPDRIFFPQQRGYRQLFHIAADP